PKVASAFNDSMQFMNRYIIVAVKDYSIINVRREGGLAIVTVRELQFRDLDASIRAHLTDKSPALASGIKWGDNVVTEQFVLVRLDGRWQFDNGNSGVNIKSAHKLMQDAAKTKGPDELLKMQSFQRNTAHIINSIGIGQIVQSIAPYGPFLE